MGVFDWGTIVVDLENVATSHSRLLLLIASTTPIIIMISLWTTLFVSDIILLFFLSLGLSVGNHLLSQHRKKISLFAFLLMDWCWAFYVHLFYRCVQWFLRLRTLWFLSWFSRESLCAFKTYSTETGLRSWC